MAIEKLFSQACENNKVPILKVLQQQFSGCDHVLEIGSGTGQHAAYFAQHLSQLTWQPSDVKENLPGIALWCDEAAVQNLLEPIVFNVCEQSIPSGDFDAVFSANTLHIMHWSEVVAMFCLLADLAAGLVLCIYGPFNYQQCFSSDSNAKFDCWLKEADPLRGIRDFEKVCELAENAGFEFLNDFEMPANNRILSWVKV